jgi:hypothetical protein
MEKKASWTQYLTWSRVMLVLYILLLIIAIVTLFLVQHFLPGWRPWSTFDGLIFPDYNCENVTIGMLAVSLSFSIAIGIQSSLYSY